MQATTHIEIQFQPKRHTVNKAELAAITIALTTNKSSPSLSILTDCAFGIKTIRKYVIDPLSLTHHPHKDLLRHVDGIIRTRDYTGYKTSINKVNSHTGVKHNGEADAAVRNVVEGYIAHGKTFTDANPPIGGMRAWP